MLEVIINSDSSNLNIFNQIKMWLTLGNIYDEEGEDEDD